MPAVPIQVDGVLYDLLNKTTQRVVLQGQASISGLEVGGGPIFPPEQPPAGGKPPIPVHPIWGPPGFNPPGAGMPPGIWGGPVVPPDAGPPGGGAPPPDGGDKPPPTDHGGWGFVAEWSRWGYFPGPTELAPKG
jgi:hypothetical protein